MFNQIAELLINRSYETHVFKDEDFISFKIKNENDFKTISKEIKIKSNKHTKLRKVNNICTVNFIK